MASIARQLRERCCKQAETKQPILDAISRPAERVIPWHEYRDRFLTEKRIQQGADFWLAHGAALEAHRRSTASPRRRGRHSRRRDLVRPHHRPLSRDRCARDAGFDYPPRARLLSRRAAAVPAAVARGRRSTRRPRSARTPARWARRSSSPRAIASSRSMATATASAICGRSWDDVIGSVANYLPRTAGAKASRWSWQRRSKTRT